MYGGLGPSQHLEDERIEPEIISILDEAAQVTSFWSVREIIEGRDKTDELREELRREGILQDPRISLSALAGPLLERIPSDGKDQSTLAEELGALITLADIRGGDPEEYMALARALVQVNSQGETKLTLKFADFLYYATSVLKRKELPYPQDLEIDLNRLLDRIQQLQDSFNEEFENVERVIFDTSDSGLSTLPYQNPLYEGEPPYFSGYYVGRIGGVDTPLRPDSEGYELIYASGGLHIRGMRGDTLGTVDFGPWDKPSLDDELPLEMIIWAGIRGLQNFIDAIDSGVLSEEELPPMLMGRTNKRMAEFAAKHLGFEKHTLGSLREEEGEEREVNVSIRTEDFIRNARALLSNDELIQRLQERVKGLLQTKSKDEQS